MEVDRARFSTQFWAEDNDGKLIHLRDLELVTSGTRMLPELSNNLVIEAWVVKFRFQATGFEGLAVTACECHRQATHPGFVKSQWAEVIFFNQPSERNSFYRRMISNTWDCVLLFEGECDPYSRKR